MLLLVGIGDWDRGGIGDWELGIGIGDWDLGLRQGVGIVDCDWRFFVTFGCDLCCDFWLLDWGLGWGWDWDWGLGLGIGIEIEIGN